MDNQELICEYSDLPSLYSYMTDEQKKEFKASQKKERFNDRDRNRIIQMAWEDRTPFEAIEFQFGLKEKDVIEFMRANSLPSSFRMWRKRMKSRSTKHAKKRSMDVIRFKCSRQKGTGNKISKR